MNDRAGALDTSDSSCVVGVFDSGVGGLTVAAALHARRPALSIRYIADSAHFPYGERTEEEVDARSRALAAELIEEGCRLLVVACNTATSASLEQLRAEFPVPIVGMEPPLKPAVERSRSHRVAVLATAGTARGERLARLHSTYAAGTDVLTIPMPGLADLVEDGEVDGPRVEGILRDALRGVAAEGIDELALGCTHYGFLTPTIERLLGPGIDVIDAAEAVARRVEQQLEAHGLLLPEGTPVPVLVSTTGDPARLERSIDRLRAAGAALPPLRLVHPAAASCGGAT